MVCYVVCTRVRCVCTNCQNHAKNKKWELVVSQRFQIQARACKEEQLIHTSSCTILFAKKCVSLRTSLNKDGEPFLAWKREARDNCKRCTYTLCYVNDMLCYVITSYVMLVFVMSYKYMIWCVNVMLCYMLVCHAMLSFVCYARLCIVMLGCVKVCCVML